jgi:hypothetical protein
VPPAAGITQTSVWVAPGARPSKAIRVPSGEKAGAAAESAPGSRGASWPLARSWIQGTQG